MSVATYCSCSKCGARYKLEGAASGEMPCPKCGGRVKPLPVAQALDPSELTPPRTTTAAAAPPSTSPPSPGPASGGLDRRLVLGGWVLAAVTAIGAVVLILQIAAQRNAPAVIKIDWPAEERSRGSFEISGQQSAAPAGKSPLVFKVDPGPHRVVVRRPGFAPVTWNLTLVAGEERVLKPAWEPQADGRPR